MMSQNPAFGCKMQAVAQITTIMVVIALTRIIVMMEAVMLVSIIKINEAMALVHRGAMMALMGCCPLPK